MSNSTSASASSSTLLLASELASTTTIALSWPFYYRCYPKKRTIQLKPQHDPGVHFSIAWCKPKTAISVEDFHKIDEEIREWLEEHDWKLTFQPVKACQNCTYGHFDESFEDLLQDLRLRYELCEEKNLPLGPENPENANVAENVKAGKIREPIFIHISHSRSSNEEFNEYLKSNVNRPMVMNIEIKK